MLKIRRVANGEVVFTVSGQMHEENIAELRDLFRLEPEGLRIVLDLKDLTLIDREVVRFLEHCDSDGIKLKNCPAYIREWIVRERAQCDLR
jgi:anti-anti-sigma regulatory factor